MGDLSPALKGDFSIADLLREAAERSIDISYVIEPSTQLNIPAMSGMVLVEEVQPDLLMSGFDLTYTADTHLEVEVDRSISCAILLDGTGDPLQFIDHPPIEHKAGCVQVLGYGEPRVCARPWRAGQRARVFGLTVKPGFFDRFGALVDGDGLAALHRFLEPGICWTTLPRSRKLVDLANGILDEPYGGTLRSLFRESESLRFMLEVASLLDEEARIIREIGRRPYERARDARELLDQSLVDPPKLLDLGRQLGVNVSTLQANFKSAFNMTIFAYVRTRRLDMARILIRDHGLGIAETSYKVGFTNAAAFATAYRRHFGHPPSAAR
jgi:AraC-like DNA-binding protein